MLQINNCQIDYRFPVLITPPAGEFTSADFMRMLSEDREAIQALLLKYGGVFFRGFPVSSANMFHDAIKSLNFGPFVNYIGGDSPRDKVEKQVYTSTEAPPPLLIPLHQEMSFIKNFPRHIYFYCDTAAPTGGATIIGDARQIEKFLNPDVRAKFIEKGLTYVSRYYYKSKVMDLVNRVQRSHKSWREVFETDSKDELEQKCAENDFEFKWLPHDWVEIRQTRPALSPHPLTNELVWFNQPHLYDFNPKLLGWSKYLAAKLFYFRKWTRLHEVTFADGSPIPRADLYHIMSVLEQNAVNFPWQKGDVMVLDNVLAMHGREPFQGPRRVLTALTA